MNYQHHLDTHSLQLKFQNVCRQINALLQQSQTACFQKISSLVKRRDRYAKQFLLHTSPTLKAGSALLLASALTLTAQAQNCKTFTAADSANPVRRAGLPQNLWQPTFVDIDGDGDLDCYETSPNQDNGGTKYVKVTFLRNTGSAKLPYYELDTANTFPKTPGTIAPFNSTVTKLDFVDIDGDGDYDCFAGDYYYGFGAIPRILYFKNIGTAKKAKFVSAPNENPISGVRGSYSLKFALADFDGDGDYDLLTTDLYRTKLFKNTGTAATPQFSLQQTSYAFFFPTQSVYDYNKDGRADIFNSYGGSATYYRNIGATGQFRFAEDKNLGPLSMPSSFITFGFADLNKDGVAEAFSETGRYAVPTSVATITATTGAGSAVTLHASPANTSIYTYQWYKNGKKVNGAASPTYTATTAGRYVVEITNNCGTGTSLPYEVTANTLNERSVIAFANATGASPLLTAYPNPFTDHFVLNLGKEDASNSVVKITDIQGRVISTVKANSSTIQLGSNLQRGVYIVQVIQNNTTVFTQKIIRQ